MSTGPGRFQRSSRRRGRTRGHTAPTSRRSGLAEPTKSAKAGSAKSAKAARPAKWSKSAKAAGPAKSSKSAKSVKSAKSAKRDAARSDRARRKVESRRPEEARKPSVARRRARVALVLGVSVVLVGFLFAFYFPTRTWLAQRRSTSNATTQLDALTSANQTLSAQANALKDPAVIARIARDQYGMVKPGEKAFVVLPPPSAPTALPKVWPFEQSVTPTGPNASQGQVAAAGSDGAPANTG